MKDIEKYIPGWKLDGLIGRGGYGEVYRIKKEEMGYVYYAALKVIEIPSDAKEASSLSIMGMSKDSIDTYYEETAREIANEIQIMESLKSAGNIVHIEEHTLVQHEDRPGWTILIRMELMEPIQNYQKRVGNPDELETVKIGKDICSALECCEEKKVIHRDVKPDNVFHSEFGAYKLGDFGIAKRLDNTVAARTQKGTMAYAAPEVFKGEKYDHTVDIYSLGIMLYMYMNRQKPPFLDVNNSYITPKMLEEAQWKRICGQPLPAPADAPPSLAAIILKACEPDPKNRYRSAADFKKALMKWEKEALYAAEQRNKTYDIIGMDKDNVPDEISPVREEKMEHEIVSTLPDNTKQNVMTRVLWGLCAALSIVIICGVWYLYSYYHKPVSKPAGKPANKITTAPENTNNTADEIVLKNYFGENTGVVTNELHGKLTMQSTGVYTDKNVNANEIVYQCPAWGSTVNTSEEGVHFYYSKGNLTNDTGYRIKANAKEIRLNMNEETLVTLTLTDPNGPEVEGSVRVDNQEGLDIVFYEWDENSLTAGITATDDVYKSGMIQFYFIEEGSQFKKGCYCDIYYTLR